MRTTFAAFGDTIFTQLAAWWDVKVEAQSSKIVGCEDGDNCGETYQEVQVKVSRQGVADIVFPTYWEVGFDPTAFINPAFIIRDLASRLTPIGPQRPEEETFRIKEFLTNSNGLAPHLWGTHLAAFIMTENAMDVLVDEKLI